MFWGDRMCSLRDPEGYLWSFATFQKVASEEDLKAGTAALAGGIEAETTDTDTTEGDETATTPTDTKTTETTDKKKEPAFSTPSTLAETT